MSPNAFNHIYIFSSLLLGVYSQLIMRWQVGMAGSLPEKLPEKIMFILHLFLNPWVLSGFIATFLGGVAWMMAMTKFEMSYAFPFMSLNYVLIIGLSFYLFGETLNVAKIIGSLLIILGIIVIARGQ